MFNLLLAAGEAPIWLFIVLGIIVVVLCLLIALLPIKLWFKCAVSGTYLSMFRLIGIKLRGIRLDLIVNAYINAKKAGLNITINELESHSMAGGSVTQVVGALIAAHSAKITLSNSDAKAIDLAGRDVLKAVNESVTPKVIETPIISTIAKDGIELKVKAKVTVKTNLKTLVGGAGEDTIISRVGEGIVTTCGSAELHTDVLENPDIISKVVIQKGLDDGTAYNILSIDIADIDVGRNIGAELLKRQAEADKEIAQAQAEERKAMAIAEEQEMKAKTQQMRAQVVAAESELPKAMAEAFKKGKIGVMDYYKLKNIEADTSMRKSLFNGKKDDNE